MYLRNSLVRCVLLIPNCRVSVLMVIESAREVFINKIMSSIVERCIVCARSCPIKRSVNKIWNKQEILYSV